MSTLSSPEPTLAIPEQTTNSSNAAEDTMPLLTARISSLTFTNSGISPISEPHVNADITTEVLTYLEQALHCAALQHELELSSSRDYWSTAPAQFARALGDMFENNAEAFAAEKARVMRTPGEHCRYMRGTFAASLSGIALVVEGMMKIAGEETKAGEGSVGSEENEILDRAGRLEERCHGFMERVGGGTCCNAECA